MVAVVRVVVGAVARAATEAAAAITEAAGAVATVAATEAAEAVAVAGEGSRPGLSHHTHAVRHWVALQVPLSVAR